MTVDGGGAAYALRLQMGHEHLPEEILPIQATLQNRQKFRLNTDEREMLQKLASEAGLGYDRVETELLRREALELRKQNRGCTRTSRSKWGASI